MSHSPKKTRPIGSEKNPFTKWYLLELGFYASVIGYILFTYLTYFKNLSDKYNSGELKGLHLVDGLIPGRKMDGVDIQIRVLLENMDALLGSAFAQIVVTWVLRYIFPNNPNAVIRWNCIFGLTFSFAISGTQTLVPLAWIIYNQILATYLGHHKIYIYISWVTNAYLLYYFDIAPIYYGNIHPMLGLLDKYRGFYKWNSIPYFAYLKIQSYALDVHYMKTEKSSEVKPFDPNDYKSRVETSGNPSDYNLIAYIGYVFYYPTWLSGPTITFNAWNSYMKVSQKSYDFKYLLLYFVRTIVAFACKIFFDHYLYLIAYARYLFSGEEYKNISIYDLGVLSYLVLKSVYLKFLCIWRFQRLIALVDGVDPPENMNRCMSNNYTVSGFWRSWHRSYNMWLIRYIYIPLGGSRAGIVRQILNVFIAFSFVIFTHAPTILSDPQILAWGWAMALFMLPEIIAGFMTRFEPLKSIKNGPYYRHLQSLGGAIIIIILVLANLCGYGISLRNRSPHEAVKDLVLYVFQLAHWKFILIMVVVLWMATQLMLAYRKLEEKTGFKKDF